MKRLFHHREYAIYAMVSLITPVIKGRRNDSMGSISETITDYISESYNIRYMAVREVLRSNRSDIYDGSDFY
jgi:hypothetical protein